MNISEAVYDRCGKMSDYARRRPRISASISKTNSDWLRGLADAYNTPVSRILDAFVNQFREVYESTAAATKDPRLGRAFRAQEALRLAEAGEDVPADEVLALAEALVEGRRARDPEVAEAQEGGPE